MARHTRGISSLDVTNLDVEGASGSRLDEDYFQGLPVLSSFQQARLPWTSRGPSAASSRTATWQDTIGILPSARAHLAWARAGWGDGLKVKEVANVVGASPAMRISIVKGLVLSLAVVLLIFFFELAFFPAQLYLRDVDGSDAEQQSGNVLWLYPVVAVSYFVASSWTVDVAKTAFRLKHGRGISLGGVASGFASSNTRRWLLQESFRVLLVANYLALALALQHIPWLGRTASFLFMSFVDAFYCFDPVLTSRGWPLERRLRYVESRWAYMTAFGILPTAVSFFHPSGLLNLFLFMAVYPFCTVLALLSSPQPHTVPGASSSSTPAHQQHFFGGGGSSAKDAAAVLPAGSSLSPLLPARLPIFLPTALLYRFLMRFAPPPSDEDDAYNDDFRPSSASFRPTVGAHGDAPGRMYSTGGYGPPGSSADDGSGATGVVGAGLGTNAGNTNSFGRRTAAQFVGGAWGNANGSITGAGVGAGAASRFGASTPTTPPLGQPQWAAYAGAQGSPAAPALGVPPAGRQPYAYAGSNPSSRSTSPIPPPPKRGAGATRTAPNGVRAGVGVGATPAHPSPPPPPPPPQASPSRPVVFNGSGGGGVGGVGAGAGAKGKKMD